MLSAENIYPNSLGPSSLPKSRPTSPTLSTKSMDLLPVVENKRKFSLNVALQSSSLLGEMNSLSARRRFSTVSDVTRKLSSTIGWKLPVIIPTQDLVTQGKCLCGQYIRNRLKRSGLFTKKLGLQRLRSIVGTPSAHIVREVFPALNHVGEELERMHPTLYTNVTRQITRPSSSDLQSSDTAPAILSAVARDLFRTDISWGKVISLFAIVSALAVDCVKQDHPEYLPKLVEGVGDVIEDELATWINENGGWGGLITHTNPEKTNVSYMECAALIFGCIFGIIILYFILRFLGYQIISCLIWVR
ncbi:bcl-2-related ovarian killer protein isoform X2 [Contarinia nasturtii]|uniref:bcl-2-related ovarian killer protein isoform X1 n=1 Tax=Contarinia nasturtii TaxID=265458 RepID=UPI0012D40A5A|nr:bcl-2-related ovarian killer protein isoform X1 [Contarinia nasturtii]XP_031620392.1 bcl-2-related ovarian killer protein isoform X2 [Contarinia nasturtii]